MGGRGVVHADEHERGDQRDGGEGAGRQTRRTSLAIAGRHDRDAGRERAQRSAELGRGERHQTRDDPTMRLRGLTRVGAFSYLERTPATARREWIQCANLHAMVRRLTMSNDERQAETPTVDALLNAFQRGALSRREFFRRAGLLGLTAAGATALADATVPALAR